MEGERDRECEWDRERDLDLEALWAGSGEGGVVDLLALDERLATSFNLGEEPLPAGEPLWERERLGERDGECPRDRERERDELSDLERLLDLQERAVKPIIKVDPTSCHGACIYSEIHIPQQSPLNTHTRLSKKHDRLTLDLRVSLCTHDYYCKR